MAEHLYVLTIIAPMITTLLVVGIIAYARFQRTRTRLADDDAYRKLAERAAAAEAETASALQAIQTALSDVRTRLTSVESILKEVG